jgi:hypothetical protein
VIKRLVTFIIKIPWSGFLSEACKRDDNVGIIIDELPIEISKA